MSLPKYVALRADTYYVRRPLPLDVQPAYRGRKEVWRSLRTTRRKEAEALSHGVLADIEREIAAKRRALGAADEERAFLASAPLDSALRTHAALANRMMTGGTPYAALPGTADEARSIDQQIEWGNLVPRPRSRAEAVEAIDWELAELAGERASLVRSVAPDGEADFGNVPDRHAQKLMAYLDGLLEADRRTLEAQRAIISGTAPETPEGSDGARPAGTDTLAGLLALWEAHRKPSARTRLEARTAVLRFERVCGPLPYAAVTDEHARRFKADLLADAKLKNGTRQKLWGMLRAMLNAALDDGLLDANPFVRVKLKLDDDSAAREVLTRGDLAALFSALGGEDWWIARIGLYTGARLGEICQLTRSDFVTIEGVRCLHIREDPEAGRSVKTRGSVRKVPLHRQLVADGIFEWIAPRPEGPLFSGTRAAASKRLNRRMRDAGLGPEKVFHSFRHTFKGAARRRMDMEWHDRLTGHAAKTVGQGYGNYDLGTLKEKVDLVAFGVET